ncbi:MAG: PrsW family glutamic-type intramembrane protease [Defluviitaleaceae bacterium]|nr:PrsW family glutamic-type intramembrane protease [Defluviitaleaceae bacterium]
MLSLAVAPVLIMLFYIYIRDKYEKEPKKLLFVGTTFGIVITFPIVFVGNYLMLFLPKNFGLLGESFYNSFVISSFTEEIFKYIVLFFLTWKNRELNEPFDGIVYGVFISLGFAFLENILYVFSEDVGGISTALTRAVISVPGHGLFGVFMGYFFTKAKFDINNNEQIGHNKTKYLSLAIIVPWMVHAFYNFLLLSGLNFFIFLVFLIILWYICIKLIKTHIESSPFKVF